MQEPKRAGNPSWVKGISGNPEGRPKILDKDKKSNKQLRGEELLSLVRKFKPHLTKAVKAAVDILDNQEASENGKLRASALIITTYKDLVKDVYDYRYDEDEGEAIQENNKPAVSWTMIDGGKG